MNDATSPSRSPPGRLAGIPRSAMITWAIALAIGGAWLIAWGLRDDRPPQVEGLFEMPTFSLTASDGTTVTDADVRGGRVVVEFIFTRCKLFCPVMSIRMGELQAMLAEDPSMADVQLVSISVDPDHDTPEVLADYGQRYNADPDRWRLLTGDDRVSVWRLVEQGFKLPVTDESHNAAMPIGHSGNWVIFDAQGRARELVSATQGPTVDSALAALRSIDNP